MSAPRAGLLERLANGIVRCDGSMGYVLVRHGVSSNTSFEFLNIEKPELIGEVHKTYLDSADVDLIQTNTFGANRFHLRSFGRGHEKFVDVINREGVEIARAAAAGTSALIGGSIGPLTHSSGDALRSRSGEGDEILSAYEEQIRALGKAGVDAFVIETVHRHDEGMAALTAARDLYPDIPVVFQVATTRRGQTVAGDDLETLIRAADELGAHCLGLNCFLDPAEMYDQILELAEWTRKPLSAQPNVGKRGQLCQGVFEAERSLHTTVRTFSIKLVEAGVRLIGGCCGITPEHIRLTREHLKKVGPERLAELNRFRAKAFETARRVVVGDRERERRMPPTGLERALNSGDRDRRPVLVEVDPPRLGEAPRKALEGARSLVDAGVRYVTVADNPGRVPRLGRDVFAGMLQRDVPEAELILHQSCADQTMVSFATELESLHHLSRNVLVISGDPPSGDYVRSSAPYDVRSIAAIRAFVRRNHGLGVAGETELPTTDYFVGGAINPRALEPQMRKFWTKSAAAGASFCLSQPIFDLETLERFYEASEALRERLRQEQDRDCHFFPGVMALVSARNARILREEFGMPVPKSLITRLDEMPTRKSARALGRQVLREVLEAMRERLPFAGPYIVTQFHNYRTTIKDLRATGWLPEAKDG